MTTTTELALQQHPISAAFPSMPEQELAALALDIEEHGQREPGILFEGMVLDGWHRYLACDKAGVEFKAVEFDGDDPAAFVKSKNWHRRHLTAGQKAEAVLRLNEWRDRGKSKSAPGADLPPTTAELAKAAGVSARTIEQAKAGHRVGLGDELRDGKVSAKTAAEVANLPPKKREKAVQAIKAGEEPPLPKPKKADGDVEKVRAELIDLQGKYADLLEKNAEIADVARELNDKLEAFETTELDDQQKLIADLQKKLRVKDAEIDRLRIQIRDANNKNNELIREVKKLQRRAGIGQ